ncbi:hypothetical protein GOODEAATRI_006868 [Goodea atripinnis]|uniref:Secreted protein n=1 Tax=Goodea atripinnis TaxID=208336 RepID=A0ABV0MFP8_9TELE
MLLTAQSLPLHVHIKGRMWTRWLCKVRSSACVCVCVCVSACQEKQLRTKQVSLSDISSFRFCLVFFGVCHAATPHLQTNAYLVYSVLPPSWDGYVSAMC